MYRGGKLTLSQQRIGIQITRRKGCVTMLHESRFVIATHRRCYYGTGSGTQVLQA